MKGFLLDQYNGIRFSIFILKSLLNTASFIIFISLGLMFENLSYLNLYPCNNQEKQYKHFCFIF